MSTADVAKLDNLMAVTPARWRTLASKILIAIFCVSMVLSVVAIWASNQIEETDRYVDTVAPLAHDPAIQSALINRVNAGFASLLNDVAMQDRLSDRDRYLAAPLASLLQQFVNEEVTAFVTSDQFPAMWEQINAAAHPVVSAVLLGEGTQSISTANGQITLDLAPLFNEIFNRLSARGVDIVNRIDLDGIDTTFVIFQSEELASAQDAVDILTSLAVVLPILAVGSLVAAVLLSIHRRRAIIWSGLGLAVAMALLLIQLAFVRWMVVDNLGAGSDPAAATAFFETLGRYLRDAARLLGLLGLLVAGTAYATRPHGWLRRERPARRTSIRGAWDSARARTPEFDHVGPWTRAHLAVLAVGLGVLCCFLVILRDPMDARRATTILLIAVLGFGALALIHARMAPVAVTSSGLLTAVAAEPGTIVRVAPGSADGVAETRAEVIALAEELSPDDVRTLHRVAVALRKTG